MARNHLGINAQIRFSGTTRRRGSGALRMYSIDGTIRGCADPDYDFILECAVRSKARVIVSNDRKHLVKMGSYECIPIVTPEQFLYTQYDVDGEDVFWEYGLTRGAS